MVYLTQTHDISPRNISLTRPEK